jgi:hypothetical protein
VTKNCVMRPTSGKSFTPEPNVANRTWAIPSRLI